MKRSVYALFIILLAGTGAYAQFPLTPIQWPTPTGGLNYEKQGSTKNFGFLKTSGYFGLGDYGSQLWSVVDMDGDGKPDLLVTGFMDSAYNVTPRQFGIGGSPYWQVYLNTGNRFSSTATQWGTPVGGFQFQSGGQPYVSGFYSSTSGYVSGYIGEQSWDLLDINGDGKPDLIVTGVVDSFDDNYPTQFNATGSPYWNVYLNTGNGFSPTPIQWPTPVGGYNGTKLSVADTFGFGYINGVASTDIYGAQIWNTIDVNNDGKPDLVITGYADTINYSPTQYGASGSPYWIVYLNTGSGFSSNPIQWATPVGGANYESGGHNSTYGFYALQSYYTGPTYGAQNWSTMDMDGDGKPDLVVTGVLDSVNIVYYSQFSPTTNPYWLVYLNTGTGFSTTATHWPTPVGGYNFQSTTLSLNMGFNQLRGFGGYTYHGAQTWNTVDINGDGKPDLVVNGYTDTAGTGIFQFNNGSNPYWQVFLNTGSGFSNTITQWTTPVGGDNFDTGGIATMRGFNDIYQFNQAGAVYGAQTWDLLDINGDGKADLVVTASIDSANFDFATQYGLPTNPYWNVYLNGSSTGLQQITNTEAPCKLYPNPNTGNFTLQFTDATQRTIEIYDVMGRLIIQPVTMQNQQQFNLGNISAGIYLLRYTQNNEVKSVKFVVEK